jgi:hypothetical protein
MEGQTREAVEGGCPSTRTRARVATRRQPREVVEDEDTPTERMWRKIK